MRLAAVDLEGLAEVVWVGLGAGVGVTLVFSLVVLNGARSAAARREARSTAATAYAALALLAFGVFIVGIVLGVNIMLSKD